MIDPDYQASSKQKRDHLTESHKVRSRILETEFWNRVFFFVLASVSTFLLVLVLNKALYMKEDKETLKKIEVYKRQIDDSLLKKKISVKQHDEYTKYLREKEKQIKDTYPLPIFLFNVFKTKANKFLYILVLSVPLLINLGLYIYLRKRFKKDAKELFYQVPKQEDPLGLPQQIKIRFFIARYDKSIIEKEFRDLDTLMRILQYASDNLDENKAQSVIDELMKEVKSYIEKFYPVLNSPEIYLRLEFILWHYIVSLYGNAPTGLIGKHVVDYGLRKALTLYTRKHLPVLYDATTGKPIKENYTAYILLNVLYSVDRDRVIFKRIDKALNPLPF